MANHWQKRSMNKYACTHLASCPIVIGNIISWRAQCLSFFFCRHLSLCRPNRCEPARGKNYELIIFTTCQGWFSMGQDDCFVEIFITRPFLSARPVHSAQYVHRQSFVCLLSFLRFSFRLRSPTMFGILVCLCCCRCSCCCCCVTVIAFFPNSSATDPMVRLYGAWKTTCVSVYGARACAHTACKWMLASSENAHFGHGNDWVRCECWWHCFKANSIRDIEEFLFRCSSRHQSQRSWD